MRVSIQRAVLAVPALLAAALAAGVQTSAQVEVRHETVVTVPDGDGRLALRDFDGDGRVDLFVADASGASVRVQAEGGRFTAASPTLAWPAGRVGWDLADADGDGALELLLLTEDGSARAHRFGADGFDAGRVLIEDRVVLPRGRRRVRFARDVDGDGRVDLALPGLGAHRLFLAQADAEAPFGAPLEIAYELRSSFDTGDPESLEESLGQDVRVPWFRIEDVDGDGRLDLVSETSDRIAFHLARPQLAMQPTWVLSLDALRAELPERGRIDFDDLFSALDQRVSWRIADLDGEGANDLIVALGPKFRLYRDGSLAGPSGTPDQVLKSSGNVIWSFIRQVEGDASLDLQLVRAERISIGRVLRSLILPSSMSFDLYTYRNEGGAFSRRPTRRNRVTLEIPRLLSFLEDAEGLADALGDAQDTAAARLPVVPGTPAAGDGVVDVEGEELQVFLGCAPEPVLAEDLASRDLDPEELVEVYFLEDFDTRGDGADRTIDLGDLLTLDLSTGLALRARRMGREPVLRVPLAFPAEELTELRVLDWDQDGHSDVAAVGRGEGGWTVQLLTLPRLR